MSNKINRNKIIIFITVLTMVISIIPINVFAEKKDEDKDKEVKISITKIESGELERLYDGSLGKRFNGNFLVIKQNIRALVWTNEKISDTEINILIQKLKVSDPSLDKCLIRYDFGIGKTLIIEQNKKGSNEYKVVKSSCGYVFKIVKGAISHIDYGYYEFNCVPKVTPTPSVEPTLSPTEIPTTEPTVKPTEESTEEPSVEPSLEPTITPSEEPTENPTFIPTEKPTICPTVTPTVKPTEEPTEKPSTTPNDDVEPTTEPTVKPSVEPTVAPSEEPIVEPSDTPDVSTEPTTEPTEEVIPSLEPEPTETPIIIFTPKPSEIPTTEPIEDNIPETTVEVTEPPIISTNTPFITPTPEIVNEIIYNPTEIIINENNYIINPIKGINVDSSDKTNKIYKYIDAPINDDITPKTGDNGNFELFIATLIISVCGIIIILISVRKK